LLSSPCYGANSELAIYQVHPGLREFLWNGIRIVDHDGRADNTLGLRRRAEEDHGSGPNQLEGQKHSPTDNVRYLREPLHPESNHRGGRQSPTIACRLKPGQSLQTGLGIKSDAQSGVALSVKDLELWNRAYVTMEREQDHGEYLHLASRKSHINFLSKHAGNMQLNRLHGYSMARMQQTFTNSPIFWMLIILLPAAYGGIHLAAWDFAFPTRSRCGCGVHLA
jgi:hypothetical protein